MTNTIGKPRTGALICSLVLFCLNAFICWPLWFANFTDQMCSVEGSFIAISRYVMRHWSDLRWFPAWFCGMPFLRVYQPGLHVSVAALATLLELPPQRAYHLLTAFFYTLGPVTLFWLCDRLTGRRGFALAVGILYSLFSPCVLFASIIRVDVGGWFHSRRYQTLVHYGEGPHIVALTLIPVAIWSLDRAITGTRKTCIPLSAFLLGAIAVTNWTATVGLAMAIAAYFAAQLGRTRASGWLATLGIAITAYLIVCPWLPPSIVMSVPANAQSSDGTYFSKTHLYALAALVVLFTGLHLLFECTRLPRGFRFFAYLFACAGTVTLAKYWGNVSLLPQAHRFLPETEMAVIPAALSPFSLAWGRFGRSLRAGLVVLLALFCLFQVRNFREHVHDQTLSQKIEDTVEYRMAKWFEQHTEGKRFFAPGSVSIWMNTFTDTPQMVGCCDQSVPSIEQRLAFYEIYSGEGAGDRYAETSMAWLKAYGVAAIGVSGPRGAEFFKPFSNPKGFEGVLPVLWRDGDDVVYGVPGGSNSLAHVINAGQEVARAPINGIDVEPLRPYLIALDDPGLPKTEMNWLSAHEIQISANMSAGQRISVQTSYAPGWRALANGAPAPVRSDALGLIIIEPNCDGPCTVDLIYDGVPEAGWTKMAQLIGLGVCIGWALVAQKGSQ